MAGIFDMFGGGDEDGSQPQDPYSTKNGLLGVLTDDQATRFQLAAQILSNTSNLRPLNTAAPLIRQQQFSKERGIQQQQWSAANKYADKLEGSNPELAAAMRANPALHSKYMGNEIDQQFDPMAQLMQELTGDTSAPVGGGGSSPSPVSMPPLPNVGGGAPASNGAQTQRVPPPPQVPPAQAAGPAQAANQPSSLRDRLGEKVGIPNLNDSELMILRGGMASKSGRGFSSAIQAIKSNRRAEASTAATTAKTARHQKAADLVGDRLESEGNFDLADMVVADPSLVQQVLPSIISGDREKTNLKAATAYIRSKNEDLADAVEGDPSLVRSTLLKMAEEDRDPKARSFANLFGRRDARPTGGTDDASGTGVPVVDPMAPGGDDDISAVDTVSATATETGTTPQQVQNIAEAVGIKPEEVTPHMVTRIHSAGPENHQSEIDEIQKERREDKKIAADNKAAGDKGSAKLLQDNINNAKDLNTSYMKKMETINPILFAADRVEGMFKDGTVNQAEQMELLYNYITALDPKSTVREGEVALARQLENLQQMIKRQLEKVNGNYTLLSPEIAHQIGTSIMELGARADKRGQVARATTEDRAKAQRVPMDMVLGKEHNLDDYKSRFDPKSLRVPSIIEGDGKTTPMPD